MDQLQDTINCIRAFNRFYVVKLGYLNQNYLGTGYNITEFSILYEIQENPGINAKALCDRLCMDKSYISRVLRAMESRNLLIRHRCQEDRRSYSLSLTPFGQQELLRIIDIVCHNFESILSPASPQCQKNLCQALNYVIQTLS